MKDFARAVERDSCRRSILTATLPLLLLGAVGASAQSSQGGLPAVAERVTTLESSVATQQTTLTTLQSAVATHQTTLTTLQSTVAGIQTGVSGVQSNLTSIQAAIASLQATSSALQAALNTLGERVTGVEQSASHGTPVIFSGIYNVPTGKRLRIETVSGRGLAGPNHGAIWLVSMDVTSGGTFGTVNFLPEVQRTSAGDQFGFHKVTSIVADGGTIVRLSDQCVQCPTTLSTVTGTLIDD